MDTKDNRHGWTTLQEKMPAGLTILSGKGLLHEIIFVVAIAIGFAITAGAVCEFLLKPLWHALGRVL